MKIGKSKYLLSRGIGFYSEYEANRIKNEATKGWQLSKLSKTGFLVFEQAEPEEVDVTIDFYSGRKKEVSEYLELYEASGWNLVYSYRDRYFIFKAPVGTLSAYTDVTSYEEKIKKENNWLIKQFFIPAIICILLLLLTKINGINLLLQKLPPFSIKVIQILLIVETLYPVIGWALVNYFKLIYPKRKEYYRNTVGFAKIQYFWRDMVLAMLIGGVIGGIIGFLMSYFNIL